MFRLGGKYLLQQNLPQSRPSVWHWWTSWREHGSDQRREWAHGWPLCSYGPDYGCYSGTEQSKRHQSERSSVTSKSDSDCVRVHPHSPLRGAVHGMPHLRSSMEPTPSPASRPSLLHTCQGAFPRGSPLLGCTALRLRTFIHVPPSLGGLYQPVLDATISIVFKRGPWNETEIQIPAPRLTKSVTLGKFLKLSVPQFPQLLKGDDLHYLPHRTVRIKWEYM